MRRMSDDRRRRWFRFSLRTMFVVVTALCCWLGWESSVVRKRQQALQELQADGAFQFIPAEDWKHRFPPGGVFQPVASVPWVRSLLGDRGT